MARFQPVSDPYRVLGVLRGATSAQIKAAHRRLAKRFHPDGGSGDPARFLEVQEAYLLLSDPRRRSEWDRAHSPAPARPTSARRSTGASAEEHSGPGRTARTARVRRPHRPDATQTRTWSAERVPWWEDFRPGERGGADRAPEPEAATEASDEFDVFDRSSGAAWSSAARRHFRRGTDGLPSRGVWRYRGTQVVTGAEARRLAAEEEEEHSS
jgi:curved DNA-binding protein CbpA